MNFFHEMAHDAFRGLGIIRDPKTKTIEEKSTLEEIESYKRIYKESKKSMMDLQNDPLENNDHSKIHLVNSLQGVASAQEWLEKNNVDVKALDAEIQKELEG